MRPHKRGESGVALVEFALIAPFLFLLILAVVHFGQLYQARAQYNSAALAAARALTLEGSSIAKAQAAAVSAGMPASLTPAISYSGGASSCSSSAGTFPDVTVRITNPSEFSIFGVDFEVSGKAVARCMG